MRRAQRNTAFYKILLVLFLATFLLPGPVPAKVITYSGNGTAGTIQTLIENSSNGDSIFLAGGTYEGNIVIDRSLVFGALDSTNPPRIITSGSGTV